MNAAKNIKTLIAAAAAIATTTIGLTVDSLRRPAAPTQQTPVISVCLLPTRPMPGITGWR